MKHRGPRFIVNRGPLAVDAPRGGAESTQAAKKFFTLSIHDFAFGL
mgnify:CR=1 FL=1|jgi:hypothetical protein